jgi:formate hydrogenlyase subunit 3/multisubunit Na+/H+ antiporter MnhD subunit
VSATATPLITGPWLPLLALVTPLLLALLASLPPLRRHAVRLLPLAPLPALPVALVGARGGTTTAPDLLLGVQLGLDERGALFLGMAATLWLLAGLYAATYLRDTRQPAVFTGFWCLTLAGNLGVFLAQDVATFYIAFATVSLAAYGLVAHEATERALRAGRIYLILAIVGEAALLGGLLLGVHAADSLRIADVRAALGSLQGRAPGSQLGIALLLVGFGLKAGLMPLHMWLPLAHPAAPTPASAVLSGAIVKAGIYGLIAFLPGGAQAADWGTLLLLVGLFSACAGVLLGLTQGDPKAVLAYSTISQMGLVIAVIGLGLTQADPARALNAATLASVHHGLAKGALFLGVGVILATGARHRAWVLVPTALLALSVAGLPLSGGAWAKAALKMPVEPGVVAGALSLSATGTALLLGRFWLLMQARADARISPNGRPAVGLWLPWALLLLSALAAPWWLVPGHSTLPTAHVLTPASLWAGLWPLLLAGVLAALALRARFKPPAVPEGDLAGPLERAVLALVRAVAMRAMAPAPHHGDRLQAWLSRATDWRALERVLSQWSLIGVGLLLVALLMAGLMRLG